MNTKKLTDLIYSLVELNSALEADPEDAMIPNLKGVKILPTISDTIQALDLIFDDESKFRITIMGEC